MENVMSWITAIDFPFLLDMQFSFKINHIFPLPLSPTNLIGDFLNNKQHVANCSVPSPFLISYIFSDRNNMRIARMTGQLERWKTRMTGKQEWPESRNYGKSRMRQCIDGTMNPAPLGDADRIRCVYS
jgi:hypothetical protein